MFLEFYDLHIAAKSLIVQADFLGFLLTVNKRARVYAGLVISHNFHITCNGSLRRYVNLIFKKEYVHMSEFLVQFVILVMFGGNSCSNV